MYFVFPRRRLTWGEYWNGKKGCPGEDDFSYLGVCVCVMSARFVRHLQETCCVRFLSSYAFYVYFSRIATLDCAVFGVCFVRLQELRILYKYKVFICTELIR